MISWIQRYFQHHFRVIFAILLAVVIISFVFTIGAAPGIGSGDRRIVDRHFFSYNLALAEDQQRLMGDAQLSVSLQFGSFGGLQPEQIQNYAFQRAAALHLAHQWHIPAATTAEVTEAVKNLRMFAGPDGKFDAKSYQTFRDNLKSGPRSGASEADIARVIGDDVRAEKVNKLLAGPGYVLPGDVKQQLNRFDTNWTIATAAADYTAWKVDVKPTDAELGKWFEESGGRYDVPPRVSVTYVDFPAASFLAEVNVTEAEVRAYYDSNPQRFPKPAEPKPAEATPNLAKPADPTADFAVVRAQVETTLKLERAKQRATRAASDLALALFEGRVRSDTLESFLSGRKLAAKPLAPFTRETGPAELGHSPEVAQEAFRLSKDRFASEAIATPTGAVVLFWKDTVPARKPLFSEVREKVAADYVENEKRKRFVELGRTLKGKIETRLKAGDNFENAAAAANESGVKLEAKSLPAFTLRTRPQDLDYAVLGALERLERGQVSDMLVTADKGVFVYVTEKKTPELNENNPAYTEARAQLASATARVGGSAVMAEIVEKELKRSMPKTE